MGKDSFDRHQKKVLALVLAFACAFTMFAGAAFTDAADIDANATEAVETLVELGVLKGYTDGSFQPNGTITRAEMAKMIYVLRTGSDNADAYEKSNTKFTDLNTSKSAWAAGYIKYCEALGIIAGKSATKFDPDATVTGQEAAKMLLVTLGYDATKAQLVGSGWGQRATALADENGLLDDVTAPLTLALPRQYAALMMFNAIDAPTVRLRDGQYTSMNDDGKDYPTIGEKYMSLKKSVGTMTEFTKTSGKDTYELTLENIDSNKSTTNEDPISFTKVSKDYSSLKYQTVKVLYKEKDKVYGIYATEDNSQETGVLADLKLDGGKAKLNGTKYSLAKKSGAEATTVYVDGTQQYTHKNGTINGSSAVDGSLSDSSASDVHETTITEWLTANAEGNATFEKGSSVKLLATDGSSNYSILQVTTYVVKEVTYIGSDYITAGTKYEDNDYNLDSNLKKDDYAVISAKGNYADDKGRVEKAEVVEGKITSTKSDSGSINKVAIDGTWYTTNAAKKGDSALRMSASVKLVLVNGYIYAIDTVTAGTSDVALIVEMGNNNTVGSKYYQARLILADGTDKVVDIEKKDGNDVALIRAANGSAGTSAVDFDDYDNTMCTYDVSKEIYTLTPVGTTEYAESNVKHTNTEYAGYENLISSAAATIDGSMSVSAGFTSEGAISDSSIKKAYLDDTAVVFVQYKDDDYKVVTGKTAKAWDKVTGKTVAALAKQDRNAQYVGAAYVDLGSDNVPGGSDKTYAVALDDSYSEKIGGTTYTMVKAWNGSTEETFKHEGTKTVAKGDVFEYSSDGEDTVDIDLCSGVVTTQVKSYDLGSGEIAFADTITNEAADGSNLKVDSKDTVVLYVDSNAGKGESGGEIQLAPQFNGDATNTDDNVAVYIESGEKDNITVIVVDVKNKIDW